MLNSFFDKFVFLSALKYKNNNFYLVNVPFAIAPTSFFASMAVENSPEFNRQLYYSIKDSMKTHLHPNIKSDFNLDNENFLNFVKDFFVYSGWGSIEVKNIDYKKHNATILVSDSPLPKIIKKSKKPIDHLLRGVFAGLFSEVFKEDVDCIETECSALGNKTCKFSVGKKSKFDFKGLQQFREQVH